MKTGFDNDKYLQTQSDHIKERIARFGGKLYLEFGGKLFDDYHAARVLPGFKPDSKIKMLMQLNDNVEAIIAINSNDIEKNKVRGDLGITYDMETLRLIDAFKDKNIHVGGVVLTKYTAQPSALAFEKKLKALKIKVYRHYPIAGYPSNIPMIVSDEGYGKNQFVETTHPLVIVTAPGPGSGKMATCLSQLYHEYKLGNKAGYAKFETFPIWNLPLRHPVNIAYEAATMDLGDINMIDPFHLEAYGKISVNYNRDIEIFPVLNTILEKISGTSPYKSPTDMGVNMAGYCIIDDKIVSEAAKLEIIRRYYKAICENKQGLISDDVISRFNILMNHAGISIESRKVISSVEKRAEGLQVPVVGIELADGRVITGKSSALLGAVSAMILNALKNLGNIDDDVLLISPEIIEPIRRLKVDDLGNSNPRLHADEMLVALSICAQTDPIAEKALSQLSKLKGCEVHSSVILSPMDSALLQKLNINVTCDPEYQTNCLFQ
ncbi:MAG: DUF1846 domain-containing protein [Candidatus Methanomethylophilaceae archaeon]|nr:DUF1846 domain-containing protein [Candidatus Methanomethylophilaceae archaeon]MDY0224711.1 DUF1846 domain-containing protein [Candidatus Methanomethylophilaceae archaeon]